MVAPRKPTSHSLLDHAYGALAGHEHVEGEFDHDHDEDFLEIDSKSLESVPLISMGLDVGSSGTQVIFTRLKMRGPGERRALRRQAKTRETLYMSPIALTPFQGDEIDEEKLWRIIERAFNDANLTPDDIETGAIILTGAAAQRSNAQRITTRVAEEIGASVGTTCTESQGEVIRPARMPLMLEAVVLAVDVERERISLGIKQLDGDPFTAFVSQNDKNSIVQGSVKSIDAKGAVIGLEGEVEGYLRASEVSRDRVEDIRTHLKEGDSVTAMIINIDRKNRTINLSIKAKDMAEETNAMQKIAAEKPANAGTTSLGALLKAKMDTANSGH